MYLAMSKESSECNMKGAWRDRTKQEDGSCFTRERSTASCWSSEKNSNEIFLEDWFSSMCVKFDFKKTAIFT